MNAKQGEERKLRRRELEAMEKLGFAKALKGGDVSAINLRNIDYWVFENGKYFVYFKSQKESFDSIDHPLFNVNG